MSAELTAVTSKSRLRVTNAAMEPANCVAQATTAASRARPSGSKREDVAGPLSLCRHHLDRYIDERALQDLLSPVTTPSLTESQAVKLLASMLSESGGRAPRRPASEALPLHEVLGSLWPANSSRALPSVQETLQTMGVTICEP